MMNDHYVRFAWTALIAIACPFAAPRAAEPMLDRYQMPLPAGAVARLGFLRDGDYANPSCAPVASTDGALLATPHGRRVIIWDMASGKVIRHLLPSVLNLKNLAFIDARTVVLSGRNPNNFKDEVSVWDARTGKNTRSFETDENHAGTAVYHLWRKQVPFDTKRFLNS
jgi:hypothetical protein